MKKLLSVSLCASLTACVYNTEPQAVAHWQAVPEVQLPEERPVVETYEVEFLPILPEGKAVRVVGKFEIRNGAELDYADASVVEELKKRAAEMGGNTIVYPYVGTPEATVAYVPIEVGMHGGDEY